MTAAFLLLAALAPQEARFDLGAGYSLVRAREEIGDAAGETSFHGWQAGAGWRVSGRFAAVVDASGHKATLAGVDASDLMLLAGPRASLGGGRVAPFVHVLAGLVRGRVSLTVFDVEIAESETDPAAAAGGGVDVHLGDRWGLRAQADYRLVFADGETVGDPRFGAGVFLRLR